MAVKALDLFCGAGGSSWGAQRAGVEILCGVDSWELATRTFQMNFPEAKAVYRELSEKSDRRAVRGVGEIDLILASPECTSHTNARGSRERNEDSRLTALYVLRFAKAFRPRWIILENVVQMRTWSRYGQLLSKLRDEMQYHVNEEVLDAVDFGVPQRRRRLFLICDRVNAPPRINPPDDVRVRSAAEILDPVGTWEESPLWSEGRAKPTLERAERAISELGPGNPFLIVYYGSDGGGGWQRLDKPLRTMTTRDRFGLVRWENSMPMLRMLQVPELRRAMGFDESFRLEHGSRRDRIKLLGNGVCPPVVQSIVEAVAKEALVQGPGRIADDRIS